MINDMLRYCQQLITGKIMKRHIKHRSQTSGPPTALLSKIKKKDNYEKLTILCYFGQNSSF